MPETNSTAATILRLRQARHVFLSSQVAVLDLAKLSVTEATRLDFPEQRARRLGEAVGRPDLKLEKTMSLLGLVERLLEESQDKRQREAKGITQPTKDGEEVERAEEPSGENGGLIAGAGSPTEEQSAPSTLDQLVAAVEDVGLPRQAVINVIVTGAKISSEKSRSGLMLESLLISAVAQFEVFVARLIATSLRHSPSSMNASERKYTFEDVSTYGSMDAFTKAAANAYVDSLMYDGMDSWMKFLAKATRSDTVWVNDLLAEVVMRRNVHVHAGGRASTQYMVALGKNAAAVKVGDELPVTEAYLEDALNRMARAAVVLSQCAVAAVVAAATSEEATGLDSDQGLVDAVFDLLCAGRFPAVAPLADQLSPFVTTNSTRERLKANSLWAQKKWLGDDAIRSEIEAWDVSAAEDELKLAKFCLLDDAESAVTLYKQLVASHKISVTELATWPILEAVRAAIAADSES